MILSFWLLVLGSPFGPRAINVPPARFLYALFEPNPFSIEQSKKKNHLAMILSFWLLVLGSNQRPCG